jgi:cytosine/adenosine deaminase-related metal-dependent hydrolase
MPKISDCVVLVGPDLEPFKCSTFEWEGESITAIELQEPVEELNDGATVVMPAMCNAHTHIGDSCLPDGATGKTLQQAFYRPNGYKYRELERLGNSIYPDVLAHLQYMAQSGTTAHIDFRESGPKGCALLREASLESGVDSVILGQLEESPFRETELLSNSASLPPKVVKEIKEILEVGDGFSESTINDLTDTAWKEVFFVTDARGKFRAVHCLENEDDRTKSMAIAGKGDLSRALEIYAPHLVVHLTTATDKEIKSLTDTDVSVAINPRANAALGLPLPPIAKLMEAEVNVLLGTDNVMLNSPNLFAEMDFAYKVARSQYGDAHNPHPSDILRMTTANAGALLGSRHEGVLKIGASASFCVIDFNAPHLRASKHIVASLITRVTPADVISTHRKGMVVFERSGVPQK